VSPVTGLVQVDFRKYDGARHWQFHARLLGEDEHGVWIGHPAGAEMRKGTEPPVTIAHAVAGVIPPRAEWVAWFNAEPDPVEIYCDVTTLPRWTAPDRVTMIDLDLDVCRTRADGSVRLLDEDEFAEHRVRYGYPPEVVERATRVAAELAVALADGTEPFAGAYRAWLDRVR
jgi:hypothetical protein